MKLKTPRHFQRAPVAWLVSLYLLGGLGVDSALAEELPSFNRVGSPTPATAVRQPPVIRPNRAAAPVRRDQQELMQFIQNKVTQPTRVAAPVRRDQPETVKFKPNMVAQPTHTAAPVRREQPEILKFSPNIVTQPAQAAAPVRRVQPQTVKFSPNTVAQPAQAAAPVRGDQPEILKFSPNTVAQPAQAAAPVRPDQPETVKFKPIMVTQPTHVAAPVRDDQQEALKFRPKSVTQSTQAAAPVRPTQQELLKFSPTTASQAALAAPPRKPVQVAPSPANTATAITPRVVEQQVHSVSALAQASLPPRLAARQNDSPRLMGPSESELRQTFNRAVSSAIERSPSIFRAQAEQQAAEADVDEAKGQRWPQLDIGTQTQPVKFGKGAKDQSGGGAINLAVTTTVYDWGRTSNTIGSRKHLASAAEESIAAERESTGYEVVNTMIELGKQRIIVDLSQQFSDRMQELVKMLGGIVAVDKGRASELTQAKARLLQAHALRDTADARARDAELTLRKLVGERPVVIPRTKEWNIRLAHLDVLLEDVKEHPTIRQANAQTESAVLQAKAVRASGLPQLNWVVSKSTAEDSIGQQQPWQTNLAVTWGAFRGGSTRAAERAALQRAEAGRYESDQQLRDLEYRIRTADHDARTLLERAELYRDLSVESSRIREDFFQQWHHLGRRTLLDVLSAENEHYGNQVSEINNRFDGYQAIVRQYAGAGTLGRWLNNVR